MAEIESQVSPRDSFKQKTGLGLRIAGLSMALSLTSQHVDRIQDLTTAPIIESLPISMTASLDDFMQTGVVFVTGGLSEIVTNSDFGASFLGEKKEKLFASEIMLYPQTVMHDTLSFIGEQKDSETSRRIVGESISYACAAIAAGGILFDIYTDGRKKKAHEPSDPSRDRVVV